MEYITNIESIAPHSFLLGYVVKDSFYDVMYISSSAGICLSNDIYRDMHRECTNSKHAVHSFLFITPNKLSFVPFYALSRWSPRRATSCSLSTQKAYI
jgi:hypothetical protein